MLVVFLVLFMGDYPFLIFGKMATFETMKECRTYIAEKVPPNLRPKFECLQLVRPTELEAAKAKESDHG